MKDQRLLDRGPIRSRKSNAPKGNQGKRGYVSEAIGEENGKHIESRKSPSTSKTFISIPISSDPKG